MTEIKILIYTDTARIVPDGNDDWAVTRLRELLEAKKSQFVEYKLDVVNRYRGAQVGVAPTPVRITEDLVRDVDEVWFFGFYPKNAGATFGLFGSDQNVLSPDEVGVLKHWMNEHGLGVLISGDHSVNLTGNDNAPVESFVCLGKAIGASVPRAKELRTWDGPPTNREDETTFSTIAEAVPILTTPPEGDAEPQRLALFNFAAGGSLRLPHRLFWGKDENGQDRTIDLLPDHQHEGEVIVPDSLGEDWHPLTEPDGTKKRPRPVVIAFGFDRRVNVNRAAPVLAVYDGDAHNVGEVKVGRIVADSSWHHFFNINLDGLAKDTSPGSSFDLLGQFYRNLAHYLAPLEKRRQIARAMLNWVLTHPGVMEEIGSEPVRWGRVVRSYLSRVATPFEIAEMFQVETPDDLKDTDSHIEFKTLAFGEADPLPTQEAILGSLVRRYYRVASERLRDELEGAELADAEAQPASEDDIIAEGIRDAFRDHNARLAQLASAARDFSDRLNRADTKKEEITVATVCQGTDRWRDSRLRPQGGSEEDDGTFVIVKNGNQFTGRHRDKNGNETDLREVSCGGQGGTLSFTRDFPGNREISYTGTISPDGLGGFTITNGTFSRGNKQLDAPAAASGAESGENAPPLPPETGDWGAEKPAL